MAFDAGITGKVTAWGDGDDVDTLVTNTGPYSFGATITADGLASTAFGASGISALANIQGLSQISGTMSARFKAGGALSGANGLVTYSTGGYTAGVRKWTLSANWQAFETTAFSASGVIWKQFIPGPLSWTATCECLIDSGTALALPHAPGATLPTVTFKVSEEGATDNTFAGSAIIQSVNVGPIESNTLSRVNYTLLGTGDLTLAGTSNIFGSGTLGIPTWDADDLILQTTTGQDIQGPAFLTGLTVSVGVNEAIDIGVTWQGTGVWS